MLVENRHRLSSMTCDRRVRHARRRSPVPRAGLLGAPAPDVGHPDAAIGVQRRVAGRVVRAKGRGGRGGARAGAARRGEVTREVDALRARNERRGRREGLDGAGTAVAARAAEQLEAGEEREDLRAP